jgi:lipopolysaccharide biosynthesis glycosyltransferase
MTTVHIGCASNSAFLIPTAAMIYSAVHNAKSDTQLNFHLIDGGLTDEEKRRLLQTVNRLDSRHTLYCYRADSSRLEGLPLPSALARETYLRLLAPALLPRELNRLLWLDGDMVLERDLADVWNTNLGAFSTGAVFEYGGSCLAEMPGTAETHPLLNLDGKLPYFNAGFILIDLARWRSQQVTEQTFSYLDKFHKYVRYHDQEGLNIVLAGQWLQLDRRWNVQMSALRFWSRQQAANRPSWYVEDAQELNKNPWIIHYTDSKPWNSAMLSRFRSRYYYYLRRSGILSPLQYARYVAGASATSIGIVVSRRLGTG